ncbi:MAG TPA: Ig-like domain-containing protein [Casimicrobiaceae bacterium]
MRHPLVVLSGICLAWLASSSAIATAWSADVDVVTSRVGDARNEFKLSGDIRAISALDGGSAWVSTGDAMRLLSQDGRVRAEIDMAGAGYGQAERIAANTYDDSVWATTDRLLLLHFARDGVLEQGTTLVTSADAIAVDLDESVWVAARDELLHFSSDGQWLRTLPLGLAADERVTALARDALRNRLWIATSGGLHLLATGDAVSAERIVRRGDATSLDLDARTGIAMAVIDRALVSVDFNGDAISVRSPWLDEDELALTVVYDAVEAAFAVDTDKARLRIASDGTLLDREAERRGLLLAATPFRVDPMLTLLRPPDGGAMTDPAAGILLRVEALCNGLRCDLPPSYLRQMQVEATIDGVPLGAPSIDETGRTIFPLQPRMRLGTNELSATIVDAFGHRAMLRRARWTLVAADAPPPIAASSDAQRGGSIDKAANKAPSVVLTQPSKGSVFAAGSAIQLAATASDADGTIAKVEFYRGGTTLIGTATSSPYQYTWTSATAGSYSLTAKAYDNRNATAVSTAVTISVVNNQPPSVTLVSPPAGAFARVGEPVVLEASASDSDGTIAGVEFLDGGVSVGISQSPPYRLSWTPAASGVHVISARATDDRGATSASPTVTVFVVAVPIVVVTGPAACSVVDGPLDVMLTADAISTTGAITSVEFLDNGISVGTASAAPWRAMLANASVGNHAITARATDDRGSTTLSRPAAFTVRAKNQSPAVALTAPTDGVHFPNRATINVAATASDPDGLVTVVEFRLGSASGVLIGRATQAPYTAIWTNVAPGSYTIVAVAYDDRNAATTSAPVHVTVDPNVPPVVSITSPVAGSRVMANTDVAVTANASDGDGTIARVDFYAGTTAIGSSTNAPYGIVWNAATPGTYSMTAKATDNSGAVVTSPAVAITVVSNALPTVALTAPAPGNYFAPATIVLGATAQDSDGFITSVDFYANGTRVAQVSSPPYTALWDAVPAGTYAITANATDDAAGISVSSVVTVTVAGPSVDIDAGLAGAMIDDDNVLVRGVVSAPPNSAVSVNGVVTHVDDLGHFNANEVPLTAGTNTVTVEVTTQDGLTSAQSIVVNSSGAGAFVVHAAPTEGLDTLQVTFTIENPAETPFKRMTLDLDNDGSPNLAFTPGQFVDGKLTLTATYPIGTWIAVLKAYDDQDEVIYSTSKSIVVLSPTILQQNLRAVYDGMLTRLKAGNISGALTAFTGSAYQKYNEIFTELQQSLPQIVDQLGEVVEMTFNGDVGELTIVQNTPEGPMTFLIYMLRSEDGIWRIDGM